MLLSRILAIAALATTAAAQGEPRLIGLTAPSGLITSQEIANCTNPLRCSGVLPPTTLATAGGTAYDTLTRGTWVTDGFTIAKVDTHDPTCPYQCRPSPLPPPFGAVTARLFATGLAFDHGRNALWVTDNLNQVHLLRINGCTLRANPPCRVSSTNFPIVGVAHDDIRDTLFYATQAPSGGQILVANAARPCTILCTYAHRVSCSGTLLRPFHGIAVDACRDTVWLTDGLEELGFVYDLANCQFTLRRCCANPVASEPYVGLCLVPATATPSGRPCVTRPCARCTPRHFFGNGDPVIGNAGFSLDADNLPPNSSVAIFLNFGACVPPPGLVVPPFCAGLLVPTGPMPAFANGGSSGGGFAVCDGSFRVRVRLTPVPSLCGLTLSSQALGFCLTPLGVGTYVSECLTWTIGSS